MQDGCRPLVASDEDLIDTCQLRQNRRSLLPNEPLPSSHRTSALVLCFPSLKERVSIVNGQKKGRNISTVFTASHEKAACSPPLLKC